MRCLRYLPLPLSLISLLLPTLAAAEPWVEDKVFFTESAKLGSSMVAAADLDGDGWIDLVFANGGGYDKGDMLSDLPQQAFKNLGGTGTMDISADIFAGANSFNGRAVKIRDIDRDGDNDIMLGCTWQKQSQLLLNTGGVLNNVTPTTPGVGVNVILLLDGPAAFHVQAGLLPRKRIETSELVPPRALAHLQSTLRVGPGVMDPVDRRVAAPALPGETWRWIERDAAAYHDAPLAPLGQALGELPERPVTIRQGWLRLDPG